MQLTLRLEAAIAVAPFELLIIVIFVSPTAILFLSWLKRRGRRSREGP